MSSKDVDESRLTGMRVREAEVAAKVATAKVEEEKWRPNAVLNLMNAGVFGAASALRQGLERDLEAVRGEIAAHEAEMVSIPRAQLQIEFDERAEQYRACRNDVTGAESAGARAAAAIVTAIREIEAMQEKRVRLYGNADFFASKLHPGLTAHERSATHGDPPSISDLRSAFRKSFAHDIREQLGTSDLGAVRLLLDLA